jgi:hypothetical protein
MTQLIQQKNQAVLSSLWELTFRTVLALLLPVALSAQTLDVTCLAKHNGDPVVADSMRIQIPILGIDVVTTSSTIDVGRIASVGQAGNESPMTVSMADIRGRYLGTAVRPAGAPRKWLDREHGVVIGMPMDAMPFHAPQEAQLQATMDVTVTVWRAFWKTSTFAATIPATEGVHMLRTTLELEPWWKRISSLSISGSFSAWDSTMNRENDNVYRFADTIIVKGTFASIRRTQEFTYQVVSKDSTVELIDHWQTQTSSRKMTVVIDTVRSMILSAHSSSYSTDCGGGYGARNAYIRSSVTDLNLIIPNDITVDHTSQYSDDDAAVYSPMYSYESEFSGGRGHRIYQDANYTKIVTPYIFPLDIVITIEFDS